jgi:hypothetical protein
MIIFKAKKWKNAFQIGALLCNRDSASRSSCFQEHHFAPAAALLPADTAQPSSSESQNPETSLGTESDSEDSDDSSKDKDYEPPGKRMERFKKTLQQISSLPKLSADPRPTNSVTNKP